ncbi:MAG TPA: AsmA-like C-terminal region-containing protein [Candidatus Acidoferrales bacterium]|nr:AsmA-like C-terminal region-containing protein [Candidatus Acidoferrales bacterium]
MRKVLAFLAIAIIAVVIAGIVFGAALKSSVRRRTERYLSARFASQVQFSHFDIHVYPHIRLTFDNVTLRHHGRRDVPPLIEMKQLSITASIAGLLGDKMHVRRIEADGLQIHTPPREAGDKAEAAKPDDSSAKGNVAKFARKYPLVIDNLRADDALLVILRSQAGKAPRVFAIHHLELRHANFDARSSFEAILTNPVPRGEIHCTGTFGPWDADAPRATPVDARYTFSHADMSTIKGLSGTLSSEGEFSGPLDFLEVRGTTDIPDFALRTSAHPVHLRTSFSAIVDGTNGNVTLRRVQAGFLGSRITVAGQVADKSRAPGRTISLDAEAKDARIGDLLQLAVKAPRPPMTGSTQLHARIQIPEGSSDLLDRLRLDGKFAVSGTRFTNPKVEARVQTLSRKGRGKPKNTGLRTQTSDLTGHFTVERGLVRFSHLGFGVTGASIDLAGNYDMNSGAMDFRGKLRLRAGLSHTMTGIKSLALRPFDHFFKGPKAGTVLPIRITGTKDHPSFALDFHDKNNGQ